MKKTIIVLLIIAFIPLTLNAYTSADTSKGIIKSLQTNPDNWFHDAYKLYYFKDLSVPAHIDKYQWDTRADCVIWVANGSPSVKVEHPTRVIFTKEQKDQIWDIYQKWANGHFAELFEIDNPTPVIIDTSEFVSLVTDEKGRKPRSLLPEFGKNFLWAAGSITVLGMIGLIISLFLKRRKENEDEQL